MDKVVQSNAASAEESSSASEEMRAQAEQMQGLVEDLVTMVEGRRPADVRGRGEGAPAGYAASSALDPDRPVAAPQGGISPDGEDTPHVF
jgi:methyl-accepting chemotaxis protein